MQRGIDANDIRRCIRQATRWQDHARLLFEVLHSPAPEDIQILTSLYRAELAKAPSPPIRWAYANATIEVNLYNINMNKVYGIRHEDFWSESQVFVELRRVVKEAPQKVMGYMSLAAAYKAGLIDEEIVMYYKETGGHWGTVVIDGRKERVWVREVTNPERWRRFRFYRDKVRHIDPLNPYLSYWDAETLYSYWVSGQVSRSSSYDEGTLKRLSKKEVALAGLKRSREAYENGFKHFSPIVALGSMIYFAWCADRQVEAREYGDRLKPWIVQNHESPYVNWLRMAYGHSCPYILELTR